MALTWRQFAFAYKVASKTTAAWSKTIGATGDYATWAAMIADMPDLIAHAVTVTIQAGTTLTGTSVLGYRHGVIDGATITIRAEKYFPTSGAIPTADSATVTTLRDAALTAAALGDDYFNGCWIFISDGTGTDNGFVPITDYVDATGDVVVASWPGAQPDNTSRYIIVGSMLDGEGTTAYPLWVRSSSAKINLRGIGIKDSDYYGARVEYCEELDIRYCGIYGCDRCGINFNIIKSINFFHCGVVGNNTDNNASHGGIGAKACNYLYGAGNGISDNNQRGILIEYGGAGLQLNNFGNGNGAWGTYARYSGQVKFSGTECSGASGNHSDPGTAGNNNADQAAAY